MTSSHKRQYCLLSCEDPVNTVIQDRYEDNLFFTAKHELWPMVSGCRRTACGEGSGWGALHGEVDDFDLGPCDKTGTAGFYSALGDSWFRGPELG